MSDGLSMALIAAAAFGIVGVIMVIMLLLLLPSRHEQVTVYGVWQEFGTSCPTLLALYPTHEIAERVRAGATALEAQHEAEHGWMAVRYYVREHPVIAYGQEPVRAGITPDSPWPRS